MAFLLAVVGFGHWLIGIVLTTPLIMPPGPDGAVFIAHKVDAPCS